MWTKCNDRKTTAHKSISQRWVIWFISYAWCWLSITQIGFFTSHRNFRGKVECDLHFGDGRLKLSKAENWSPMVIHTDWCQNQRLNSTWWAGDHWIHSVFPFMYITSPLKFVLTISWLAFLLPLILYVNSLILFNILVIYSFILEIEGFAIFVQAGLELVILLLQPPQ